METRRTRQIWRDMIRRCHDPRNKSYPDYGARGIAVCPRWRASFDAFLEDMGQAPDDRTLDRKDNDGPYSKKNCRWATRKEQNRNSRNNRLVTYQGETLPISAFAERSDIPKALVYTRLWLGWTLHDALTVRPQPKGQRCRNVLSCDDKRMAFEMRSSGRSYRCIADRLGVSVSQVFRLLNPP